MWRLTVDIGEAAPIAVVTSWEVEREASVAKVAAAGTLEKKWSSVVRQQRKIGELEKKVAEMTEELANGGGGGGSDGGVCEPCDAGYFKSIFGTHGCKMCLAGKYQEQDTQPSSQLDAFMARK